MGEVPRIRIDRRCMSQLKRQASTIERLFGVHLALSSCHHDNSDKHGSGIGGIVSDDTLDDESEWMGETEQNEQVLVPLEPLSGAGIPGYFITADVGGDGDGGGDGGGKQPNTSLPDDTKHWSTLPSDIAARVQVRFAREF